MLHPLPFTTIGEIAALGLKATVYCSACYEHRNIDPAAERLRDRCFATTRFRCTEIRYTGAVRGCARSVEIEPSVMLPIGGEDTLAFLSCSACVPSWEINYVPIDKTPRSVVMPTMIRVSEPVAMQAQALPPLALPKAVASDGRSLTSTRALLQCRDWLKRVSRLRPGRSLPRCAAARLTITNGQPVA
jgi:hypothetical protein